VDVCFWRIVLKKSVFADDWKIPGPLVRVTRCDVGTTSIAAKAIADARINSTEPWSG
jgi:hypothetical protein